MNKSYRIRQRFRSYFWVPNPLIDQKVGTHKEMLFSAESWRIEQIRDAQLASMHFALLLSHGAVVWHLAVRFQVHATSHNNNKVSCHYLAEYRLCIKSNWYTLLHGAARLILCLVSTLLQCVYLLGPCHLVHRIQYYYYYFQFIVPIKSEVINQRKYVFNYWYVIQ